MTKGVVRTVLGDIRPEDLGPTLLHEHVLCDIRPPAWRCEPITGYDIALNDRFAIDYGETNAPGNLILNQVDVAAAELQRMASAGGRAIVDLSCGGLSPDPKGLVRAARQAGVHVIMGCGWYVEEYLEPSITDRTVDDLASEMISQVKCGAWGTDVKAGILGEIGCQAPWTPTERKVMEAAAIAMKETGASLSVHPGRDADQPQEVAEFLAARGADLGRVIISHIDRTIFDDDRLLRLADTGVVLEFDLFGMETTFYKLSDIDMPNDGARVKTLSLLKSRGHLERIAISHDICYRSRLQCFGGHGYGHIFRNVIPLMLRRDFSATDIEQILVHTPARLLTLQ